MSKRLRVRKQSHHISLSNNKQKQKSLKNISNQNFDKKIDSDAVPVLSKDKKNTKSLKKLQSALQSSSSGVLNLKAQTEKKFSGK